MSKSYITISDDKIKYEDSVLVRIKNKKGILGGYIQQYKLSDDRLINNLSEDGGWIDSDIKLIGINGRCYVCHNSKVRGKGILKNALISHSNIELNNITLENCLVYNVNCKLNIKENSILKHKFITCYEDGLHIEEGDW